MDLTEEIVRELFDYDKDTGVVLWRTRAREWFKNDQAHAAWNTKFAGKVAGNKRLTSDRAYWRVLVFGKEYVLARIIYLYMTGKWPELLIDHIDGNTFNNKWSNLREATFLQNSQNSCMQKNNKSGYKGVYFVNKVGKYCVSISVNGISIWLGSFSKAEEASKAYEHAARKHFGEFYRPGTCFCSHQA